MRRLVERRLIMYIIVNDFSARTFVHDLELVRSASPSN